VPASPRRNSTGGIGWARSAEPPRISALVPASNALRRNHETRRIVPTIGTIRFLLHDCGTTFRVGTEGNERRSPEFKNPDKPPTAGEFSWHRFHSEAQRRSRDLNPDCPDRMIPRIEASETNGSCRHKTFHRDPAQAVASLPKIRGHLHPQPCLGRRPEGIDRMIPRQFRFRINCLRENGFSSTFPPPSLDNGACPPELNPGI